MTGDPELEAPRETGGAHGAATRVVRNTTVRAVAELLGKFASLALMAVLAREEGAAGLGVFVFALAWSELATTPIGMGLDRYFLRRVAAERAELERGLSNVFALKLARAVPIVAASCVLAWAIGYDGDTLVAIYVLTIAFLLDSFSYTVFAAFNAVERGDLVGLTLVAQRIISGGVGIALLIAGYGVVEVAFGFVGASLVAFVFGLVLLVRQVERPRIVFPAATRKKLRLRSRAFAVQEVLSVGIARLDAVLLALIASSTVVGLYGAAYRLLESTVFIPGALQGAFVAMFTYLDDRSDPTIKAAFGRAIKLAVVLLTPCAVPLAVVPGPILELLFGDEFGQAATALRLLAPCVVLLGIVLLSGSLIASRLDPKILVFQYGIALVVNVALNLALIPALDETGAAIAMLATQLLFAVLMLRVAIPAVGGLNVVETLAAPLAAAVVMAAVLVPLGDLILVALVAGAVAYVIVFALVERRVARDDFDFVVEMVRGRLPSRVAARLPS